MLIAINPTLYPIPPQKHFQKVYTGVCLPKLLAKDTVSFCGKQNDELLSITPKEIFEIIDKTIKDKSNKLGQGGEAAVYRIPDTAYCVRINLDYKSKLKSKFSLDVSDKDKVNHIVANLGGKSSIMHFIDGYPMRPTGFITKENYVDTPKMLEQIPVEGFQMLLKQVSNALNKSLKYDCNATNVMINPKDNTLTAIDFFEEPKDISRPSFILSELYVSVTPLKTTKSQKQKAAGKILLAALEELKAGEKSCYPINDFDFSRLIYKLNKEGLIQSDAYKNILIKTFEKIVELKNQEIKAGMNLPELNRALKVANSLVKQLFFNNNLDS